MIVKKCVKILLLMAMEVLFLKCVEDLTGYQKIVTEGELHDKIIYLLYMKDDNWWGWLPMDVHYKCTKTLELDSALYSIEVKTDEMEIRTVGNEPPENKTLLIRWCVKGMDSLIYSAKMDRTGIHDRYISFHYEEKHYQINPDVFEQEEVYLLECATGINEFDMREYIEQCDTNTVKFIEDLCHREKYNLLLQISIYLGMMTAGFIGMVHIARRKVSESK